MSKLGSVMQGPQDSPYEGYIFELGIRVPDSYPLAPPAVHFVTKIFHPNVHFKVRWHAEACAVAHDIATP